MVKDVISIVENSKVTHPIAMAASKGTRYWNDFLQVTEDYKKNSSGKTIKSGFWLAASQIY